MKKHKREIARLERYASREDISIPERLHTIYRIYALRGIPRYVYSEGESR